MDVVKLPIKRKYQQIDITPEVRSHLEDFEFEMGVKLIIIIIIIITIVIISSENSEKFINENCWGNFLSDTFSTTEHRVGTK